MTRISAKVLTAALAAMALSGCGDGPFDASQARAQLESGSIELQNEQVVFSQEALACGEREELWRVSDMGGGKAIARITDKARGLGLSDDVRVGNPEFEGRPFTQVRGKFQLQAPSVKLEDVDAQTKVAEAGVTVKIDHSCFSKPVTLMGIHKGQFTDDSNPKFRFRRRGGDRWEFDQVVH